MRDNGRNREAGIALVLALLSLMLLTFLGLALAASTSTELQIATNYRWSQQAFYNAEAGLDVAKSVLGGIADWRGVLPPERAGVTWVGDGTDSPSTPAATAGTRDYEYAACDHRGLYLGYGRVLVGADGTVYNNVGVLNDPTYNRPDGSAPALRGAFTVWIRRNVVPEDRVDGEGESFSGSLMDAPGSANIRITVEGVAPYANVAWAQGAATLNAETHQAVRTLQATFRQDVGEPCDFMDPEGAGFAKCFEGDPGFTGDNSIR